MAGSGLAAGDLERLSSWPGEVARSDLVAHFTLSLEDLRWLRSHRGVVERIGLAVQLAALGFLGFIPTTLTDMPREVIDHLATQIGVSPARFTRYAREADGRTRRRHVAAVVEHAGWRACGQRDWDALAQWLAARALEHDTPAVLFGQALERLRADRVVRPGLDRLMRAVSTSRVGARTEIHRRLAPQLTPERCELLDDLLVTDPQLGVAPLVWLGDGATTASAEAVKGEVAKLAHEKTGERVRRRVGWLTVPVFDVSQTDGPALPAPPAPAPLTGDSHAHLWDPLVAAAAQIGVRVSVGDARGAEGYFRPSANEIVIEQGLAAPNARVLTLLHELAHAEGADPQVFGRAGAEVIAETAAFVAARAVGLQADPNSILYVSVWADADLELLEQAAGAVDQIASRLERALGLGRDQAERDQAGRERTDGGRPAAPQAPRPAERAGAEAVRYVAERTAAGARVSVHGPSGARPLEHLARHSPTGFEWGYAGSGPADLARSIVGHATGDRDPHPALYQAFKRAHLCPAPHRGFQLSQAEVLVFVERARQLGRDGHERAR